MAPSRTLTHAALLCLTLAACVISGCDRKPAPQKRQTLTVLAAASLAESFREVGKAFELANPGVTVQFSFAGSNQLRSQLENGGPGDVFASADRKQMDAAVASKVVDVSTVRVFAQNRLALIVPKRNRAGLQELSQLARPGLQIVVADKAVPAGNYTRLMLEKAGNVPAFGADFVKAVEGNIVSREENVAAVVAKVALDEADAGIAYASDAAGDNGPRLVVLPIPDELGQQADYLVAVTARASDRTIADQFVQFLLSKDAATVLLNHGFTAPGPGSP